jgi:hypothetical protein
VWAILAVLARVGLACLDLSNNRFARPVARISGTVPLDGVLTPDLISFSFVALGRAVHPEHVLDALARLGTRVNPKRAAECSALIRELEQYHLAKAGGDGDPFNCTGKVE